MADILIVEARFYAHLNDMLIAGARAALEAQGHNVEVLTVPGALDFFVGGGVVYSFRARDVLFALPREAYNGMRGATEDYALLQARAISDNFGAEWGLAESGSVGGSTHPSGAPAGRSVAALAGPGGEFTRLIENASDDRITNMAAFTRNALALLEDALAT